MVAARAFDQKPAARKHSRVASAARWSTAATTISVRINNDPTKTAIACSELSNGDLELAWPNIRQVLSACEDAHCSARALLTLGSTSAARLRGTYRVVPTRSTPSRPRGVLTGSVVEVGRASACFPPPSSRPPPTALDRPPHHRRVVTIATAATRSCSCSPPTLHFERQPRTPPASATAIDAFLRSAADYAWHRTSRRSLLLSTGIYNYENHSRSRAHLLGISAELRRVDLELRRQTPDLHRQRAPLLGRPGRPRGRRRGRHQPRRRRGDLLRQRAHSPRDLVARQYATSWCPARRGSRGRSPAASGSRAAQTPGACRPGTRLGVGDLRAHRLELGVR